MWRRLVNLAAAVCLATTTVLQWLGLRKRRDPWRAMAALNLRGENAKFSLAAFSIRTGDDEKFARELREFLAHEPVGRVAVEHRRFHTRPIAIQPADVTLARFDADGRIQQITPFFDPAFPPKTEAPRRAKIHHALLYAINATQFLPATKRPKQILRLLSRRHRAYALRILQSTFLSFAENPNRDAPPDPRVFRHPGVGLLNFTALRLGNGAVDLWMQVHHVPVDAAPMQTMLRRLQLHFGTDEKTILAPAANTFINRTECWREGRDLILLGGFFDFLTLREWQRKMDALHRHELTLPLTTGAALIWQLGRQPEFDGIRFAFVIDVPADENYERSVDFIIARPRDFMRDDAPDGGFGVFVRDYDRRLCEAQTRRSRTFRTMRNLSMLPPALAHTAMRLNVRVRHRAFGTCGITLLPTANCGISPIGDLGFEHGFISIGKMQLLSSDDGLVGGISIKGEPHVIECYPDAIRRALRCEAGIAVR